MSNAARGNFSKGDRNSSAIYKAAGNREKNKARRIARDKARMKKQPCGHGIRHKSNVDETCKRCYGERQRGARQ